MKNFLLLFLLCSISLLSKSQVITGVYKGKMVSDSLKYTVDFELTLKEKNGELIGYCQRLFLIDDVLYYNLVKVKARIKDSVLIVEDEKSVSNNFKEKTKGIKTVYMFNIRDIVDTASVLRGEWSTSAWRNNYALPGSLIVNRERNYLATQLYKRLEEKQLSKEMLFDEAKPVYASTTTKPQPTDVVTNQPSNKPPTNTTTQNKPDVATTKDSVTNAVVVNQQQETKPKPNDIAVNQITTTTNTNAVQNKPVVTIPKDTVNKTSVSVNNPQSSTTKPVQNTVAGNTAKDTVNKNSVAANNSQQPTTKPNTVSTNQPVNNKPPAVTPTQNQSTTTTTNKTNSTTGNNSVATQQTNKPITTKDSITKTSVATNNPPQQKPQQQPVTTNKPTVAPPTQTQSTVANNNKPATNTQQQTGSVASNNKPATNSGTTNNPPQNSTAATTKPAEQKPTTPVVTNPIATNPTESGISTIGNIATGNVTGKPQVGDGKPPVINNPVIVKRQVEIIEALEVTEDSVVLSLYDNGEIDEDTVSVFLNNELIVPKVGIKASAYKKTIAVKPGEVIQLTLFAENLGSIPPNTGLLIITTSTERYQVNFSSTLNKSSSIVLKRKE